MNVTKTISIELEENAVMFLDVEVNADVNEGEAQTWDNPGYDAEALLCDVRVVSFGAGTITMVRNEENDRTFQILDIAAKEVIEADWETHEEAFLQDAADEAESALADRYERD